MDGNVSDVLVENLENLRLATPQVFDVLRRGSVFVMWMLGLSGSSRGKDPSPFGSYQQTSQGSPRRSPILRVNQSYPRW